MGAIHEEAARALDVLMAVTHRSHSRHSSTRLAARIDGIDFGQNLPRQSGRPIPSGKDTEASARRSNRCHQDSTARDVEGFANVLSMATTKGTFVAI
jgi:hypothetical protein